MRASSLAWFSLGLLILAVLPYTAVAGYGFLSLDDDLYVTHNPQVRGGPTREGIAWAFGTLYADNYHPLTWISHMLDCRAFGLAPAGPHLVNVILHAATAVLLFLALSAMTGEAAASALVAALFAVHPLRVEAVAWIAERKELLAGFFFAFTLLAYAFYARRPGLLRYGLVAASYALGLLAKPTLVTLPPLLLLLDLWPLSRFTTREGRSWGTLLLEKVPLLGLSLASCAVTILAQRRGGALGSFHSISLAPRLANAAVSYVAYLGQMLWPARLAVFYPHPSTYAGRPGSILLPALASGILLCAASLLVVRLGRSRPYLAVGWFWYLGMLLPMIGVLQVGMQARADRYTYLPGIGLCLLLVWSVREAVGGRIARSWRLAAAGVVILLLAGVTRAQVRTWRSDTALYEHALRVTANNYFAHNNLGVERMRKGQLSAAAAEFEAALRIKPDYPDALFNEGGLRMREGRYPAAQSLFERTLALAPRHARAEVGLGAARLRQGDREQAARAFERALSLDPRLAEAENGRGVLRMEEGDFQEAVRCFGRALDIEPEYPEAHSNLGKILRVGGRLEEAEAHQKAALRARPEYAQAEHELGLVLEARGDLERSRAHLRRALELQPQNERVRRDLEALESRASGTR